MDTGQLHRVQTIAGLTRRSKSAAQENTESANGLAISLLHDAIEHALNLTLLDAHQSLSRREDFKELIAATALLFEQKTTRAMPFQRQLADLNRLRVAFKHYGTSPTRTATLEACANGRAFLEVMFREMFSVEIESFQPLDLLRTDLIRAALQDARSLSIEGKYDEAMCEIAGANHRIDSAFGVLFSPPRPPMLPHQLKDAPELQRLAEDLVRFVSTSDSRTLVASVLIAAGLDVFEHSQMRSRLPVVHPLIGGRLVYDKMWRHPYTAEDVDRFTAQVARLALWLEERFPTLTHDGNEWKL